MKTTKNSLIISSIIVIIAICLCSCAGSRKVSKSELKEDTKIETTQTSTIKEEAKKETETNVKETTTVTIDEAKNVVTEVTEIVPIDATKDANFTDAKGQKYNLNNSKYRNEKTTDLSKEKTVSKSEYEKLLREAQTLLRIAEEREQMIIELQKKIDVKDTQRITFNFLWLLLLLIPLGLYWYYKRFGFRFPF